MADVALERPSFKKTLISFLLSVIIVRIVNIAVRAAAEFIYSHIYTDQTKNSTQKPMGASRTETFITYIEVIVLIGILGITYLYQKPSTTQ